MNLPPIAELVPHVPPMILIDDVESYAASSITCRVTLSELDPFMQNGQVRAAVCLEYMAQAIAAQTGLRQRERGEEPRPGYIINVRSLKLHRSFLSVGDQLKVHATMILNDINAATFEAHVEQDGNRVAEGQISVFQPAIATESQ